MLCKFSYLANRRFVGDDAELFAGTDIAFVVAFIGGFDHSDDSDTGIVGKAFDHTKIEEYQFALRRDEQVSGVWICVEKPPYEHLLSVETDQRFDEWFDIDMVCFYRLFVVKTEPLFKAHHQGIITGVLLVSNREAHRLISILCREFFEIDTFLSEADLLEDHI